VLELVTTLAIGLLQLVGFEFSGFNQYYSELLPPRNSTYASDP